MDILKTLAAELQVKLTQVQAAVELIDQGNTIPFIARYRKEVTGSLDDTVLRTLDDRLTYLRSLEKRREEVRASIDEQGKLTPQLAAALAAADTLARIEDLYLPYKKKRRTRASVARERGLEPLADALLRQDPLADPLALAAPFADPEQELPDAEAALAGARDILAETFSDSADLRGRLRAFMAAEGVVRSAGEEKDDEAGTYAMYRDFAEPVKKLAPHRVLALNRGAKEKALKVGVELDADRAVGLVLAGVRKNDSPCAAQVAAAAADGWKRLIFPSLENELMNSLFETASEQAIKVFALNLGHLLMQPPVKGRVVLGLDPAYRTGCKIAVVDATGKVLDTAVVYPTPPQKKVAEAKAKLAGLIRRHGVTVISIGNGTASRESEAFVAELIRELKLPLSYMIVSEAGASVYSASKLAADEFPEYDVSLRSAVSIARRLQDPLAELVKIDPKAIGIGQYQHDMPPARLDQALGGVVERCVNSVGVDLNTASFSLLEHVAGITPAVAKNIVAYREKQGAFKNRKELLKVEKLGPKAAQQCSGFLRVYDGTEVLDCTAVHPESYDAARRLLRCCGFDTGDVLAGRLGGLRDAAERLGFARLCGETGVGEPTLRDIIAELQKPGRDPRDQLPPPLLRTDVVELKDLKPGMELSGTVRNVTDFGAFVDIGVHEDGLVHISQLADRFVRHPGDVVKVGDVVRVRVLEVDLKRGRISLTMRTAEKPAPKGS